MSGYIYVLIKQDDPLYAKIGSTMDLLARMYNYKTPEREFNNKTHELHSFKINKSKYNCYEIDDTIRRHSIDFDIPYKKYHGSGGMEHYYFSDINNLKQFLKDIDIDAEYTQIDIDELFKNPLTTNDIEKIYEFNHSERKIPRKITEQQYKEQIKLLKQKKLNEQPFVLKPHQQRILDIMLQHEDRYLDLITACTGSGKTIILILFALLRIKRTNKNIIVVTKKKEITKQLVKSFKDNVGPILNSIIKDLDINSISIVDCIDNLTLESLNENTQRRILIVNTDKFTSSSLFKNKNNEKDYSLIKYEFFDSLIFDECHHVGAPGIYEFMKYIKDKTQLNILGTSATPLRCQYAHRTNTEDIFSINGDLNILYDYSYAQALYDKIICPVLISPMIMKMTDFIEANAENDKADANIEKLDVDELDDDQKELQKNNYKVLSKDSYSKVWDKLTANILSVSYVRKGIMWFRNRIEMMDFVVAMKQTINDAGIKLFVTMTYTNGNNTENKKLVDLVNKSGLNKEHFDSAINNFINTPQNAILLAVQRCSEGFNDDTIDFAFEMYYSTNREPLQTVQRMGRLNRFHKDKKIGYYIRFEIGDNEEELKKSIISQLKDWIQFVKTYNVSKYITEEEKEKNVQNMKEIIYTSYNVEILKTYNIDIEKDIIAAFQQKDYEIKNIIYALKRENQNRMKNKIAIINTKSEYDKWAKINNYPICDELEERGFNDFKLLFSMKDKDYLSFGELKALCIEYSNEYFDMKYEELYKIIKNENDRVPPFSMIAQLYKEYNNIRDLFPISL